MDFVLDVDLTGVPKNCLIFAETLQKRAFKVADIVKLSNGKNVKALVWQQFFQKPILIENPTGLGIKLPQNLSFETVYQLVGEDVAVNVIDGTLIV